MPNRSVVSIQRSTVIRRSPTVVFRSLATAELATAWRTDLLGVRQTSSGLPRLGTTATGWRQVMGLPVASRSVIETFEPDHLLVWRTDGVLGAVREEFRLTETDEGTEVACRFSVERRVGLPGWRDRVQATLASRLPAQLQRLRDWLADGTVDESAVSHALIRPRLNALTRRKVGYDVHFTPVADDHISIEVDRRHATCEMYCVFCPRTVRDDARDLAPPDAAAQARIREGLRRAVHTHPDALLALWSDDLLRYPGLFDLLDDLVDRRIHIHTPGLALADPAFSARFVGRDVVIDLTIHADDPDTFLAMCGNPEAHALTFAALDNLHAQSVPYSLSTVVTDRNVEDVAALILSLSGRYQPETINLRVFYPDGSDLGDAYARQFPSYGAIADQLRLVAADTRADLPLVTLANLPACQVDAATFDGLRATLSENRNALRTFSFDACVGCPAHDSCPGVHPAYAATWPVRTPDRAHVLEVLARLATAGPPAREQAPPEPPPGEPLDARGDVRWGVEPRGDGRRYWLAGPRLGAWYRIDEACERRDAVEAAFRDVRARAERARVALDEQGFRTLAAWLREHLARHDG